MSDVSTPIADALTADQVAHDAAVPDTVPDPAPEAQFVAATDPLPTPDVAAFVPTPANVSVPANLGTELQNVGKDINEGEAKIDEIHAIVTEMRDIVKTFVEDVKPMVETMRQGGIGAILGSLFKH